MFLWSYCHRRVILSVAWPDSGKSLTPVYTGVNMSLCVSLHSHMHHACVLSSQITAVHSVIQVSEWQENLYIL